MASLLLDRIKETTNSNGTGDISLLGAVTGYRSFSEFGDGNQCYYVIENRANGEWEVGLGTVDVGVPNKIARNTILSSSNAGSIVNFSAGTKDVFCSIPATQLGLGRFGGYSTDYIFHATTTGSGISSGNLRLNNATFASVTHAYIHKSQRFGISVAAMLSEMANSGNYGLIKIYKESTLDDNWIYARITNIVDQTTYFDFTLTYISGHGSFSATDVIVLTYSPTGPRGLTGDDGEQGEPGEIGPAGAGSAVNLFDNPAFMWAQMSVTGSTDVDNAQYFSDRWFYLSGTGQLATARSNIDIEDGDPFSRGAYIEPISGAIIPRYGWGQIVPFKKLTHLSDPTLSLSCNMKAGSALTVRYAILYDNSQVLEDDLSGQVVADWEDTSFTTGNFFGSDYSVIASGSFSVTTTRQVFSASNIHVGNRFNVIVFFWVDEEVDVSTPEDQKVWLSQMCLVLGSETVPWTYTKPEADFIECCSYFQKSTARELHPSEGSGTCGFGEAWKFTGPSVTNPTMELGFQFPVKMIKEPELVFYDGAGTPHKVTACGADNLTPASQSQTASGGRVVASPTYSGTTSSLYCNWTADANLGDMLAPEDPTY